MSTFVEKLDSLGNVTRVGLAKLVTPLNDSWKEYANENGETKRVKLVTIELVTPSGKVTSMIANIHEKNIERMEESGSSFEPGRSYLTTLQRVERNDGNGLITFARMSHLTNAVTDEAAMDEIFGSVEVGEVTAPIAVTA